MSKYREVRKCKECGKIYSTYVPNICKKCGTELKYQTGLDFLLNLQSYTNKCESVIARRKFLKWEIKEQS